MPGSIACSCVGGTSRICRGELVCHPPAGLSRWFYCLVVNPLRYYPAPSLNNWRVLKYEFQANHSTASRVAFLFVYRTAALVYIVFLLVMRRQ